jgi:hypothetical protein
MKLESALETVKRERQKLKTSFETEQRLFSGIETLDELLCGFKLGTSYTFVARPNNGMTAFFKTITDHINILYQRNNTPVLNLTYRPHGILYDKRMNKNLLVIIIDTSELNDNNLNQLKTDILNFENDKVVIIFIYVLKNELGKPITLNEIPKAIRAHSDTIISLFRPEHYNLAHWNDGTSTKQQLECTLLQDANAESKSIKLYINDKQNRIQSCYNPSPFLQTLTTRIKTYLEE